MGMMMYKGKCYSGMRSAALNSLTDVGLTNLADGQFIVWDDELQKWVNTDKLNVGGAKTVTGRNIEINDASKTYSSALSINLKPAQNLNGYEYPWYGGFGKNLFPMTVESIKSATGLTGWVGNTITTYGVTIAILTDDSDNVVGLKVYGKPDKYIYLKIGEFNLSGSYILNGPSMTHSLILVLRNADGEGMPVQTSGNDVSFSRSNTTTAEMILEIAPYEYPYSSDYVVAPMIRRSDVSSSTFEPYTNISKIKGYDDILVSSLSNVNYFPAVPKQTITQDGVTVKTENGVYIFNGTATKNIELKFRLPVYNYYVPEESGSTLYLKCFNNAPIGLLRYYNGNDRVDYDSILESNVSKYLPFLQGTKVTDIGFSIYEGTTFDNVVCSPMFTFDQDADFVQNEVSNSSFPVTIYGGAADLVNGKVLDSYDVSDIGSLDWELSQDYSNCFFVELESKKSGATYGYCDCYKVDTTSTSVTSMTDGSISFSIGDQYIWIKDSRFSTASDLKAALTGYEIAYEVNIPVTYDIKAAPIRLIKDYCKVSNSAGGAMSLSYWIDDAFGDVLQASEDITDGIKRAMPMIPSDIGSAKEEDVEVISNTSDNCPCLSKISVHDAVYERPVGVTFNWNQLIQNGNFSSASGWTVENSTMSISNNVATLTIQYAWPMSDASTHELYRSDLTLVEGHKYLISCSVNMPHAYTKFYINLSNQYIETGYNFYYAAMEPDTWHTFNIIQEVERSEYTYLHIGPVCDEEQSYAAGDTWQIKNVYVTDLTQMLNDDIASYAYGLNVVDTYQFDGYDGINWLQSFGLFTKEYYQSVTGGLISAKLGNKKYFNSDNQLMYTCNLGSDDLRGLAKLVDGKIVYDGDVKNPDGSITRKYGYRAYQAGDENLTDAITDGTNTVYKLTTPTTQQSTTYMSPQVVYKGGKEEYADSRDCPVPVGNASKYIDLPEWMSNVYFTDLRTKLIDLEARVIALET